MTGHHKTPLAEFRFETFELTRPVLWLPEYLVIKLGVFVVMLSSLWAG